MPFQKIKPGGWLKKQTLTAPEINQLDQKITQAFDLRSGYTNNIVNDLVFENGSSVVVNGNNNFSVRTDNFKLNNDVYTDAAVLGKSSQISLGYKDELITSEGSVASGQIVFTGTVANYYFFGLVKIEQQSIYFNIAPNDDADAIAVKCAAAINAYIYLSVFATAIEGGIVRLQAKEGGTPANQISYSINLELSIAGVTATPTGSTYLTGGNDPVHSMSTEAYLCKTIKLTGTVGDNTYIQFPFGNKYEKIIINETNKDIKLKDSLGNIFVIPVNKAIDLYCDGTKFYQIGKYQENTTTYIYSYAPTSNHGTVITTFSNTAFQTPTSNYYYQFNDCKVGDFIEVSYNVRTYNTSSSGLTEFAVWYNAETNIILESKQYWLGLSPVYLSWRGIVPVTNEYGIVLIGLCCRVSLGIGYVEAPTDFNVRHIRA